MTDHTSLTPAPEPAARKPVSCVNSPLVTLVASLFSWFLFSLSSVLFLYSIYSVMPVGGTCARGNTAYTIAVQCPQDATVFLPWVIFTALITVGIGVGLANGTGFQTRVWAWPFLFGILGGLFLLAFFSGAGAVGLIVGILFIVMALVPLVIELRASVQRVFLGSFSIFGQQFREGPKAQSSFSSRKMPKPPDAVTPKIGDWAVAILGLVLPAYGGFVLAGFWLTHLYGA